MVSDASADRDWSSAAKPGWIASHLFVAFLIAGFVWAGFWQLDRLDQRQAQNDVIMARSQEAPRTVDDALIDLDDELAYVVIEDTGSYLDGEVIRVANRSQNGIGGDWVVGLFETDGGRLLLVNRGFATRDAQADPPPAPGPIAGWLQPSQQKDGFFGATDTGEGVRVPRLDVAAISARLDLDRAVAPVWLQLDDPAAGGTPQPVPLPAIDEGNHFSYAMQWFSFAGLGVVVYGLLLRKKAGEAARAA